MADAHKNFAYSTILTAPSPAQFGTSLVVQSSDGTKFPTPPFNATVWPVSEQPTSANAEIVRVTAIATDTFTIQRMQEGSYCRDILVGDQIAATITARTISEAENLAVSWSPYILAPAGTGMQTLVADYTSQSSTASLVVFPVTIQKNIEFNQIFMVDSLSFVTSNGADTIKASHYSKFGFYSMNANTLSLISSSSFSLALTNQSVSMTMIYPASTHTSGYGYYTMTITGTAEMSSYISASRGIGLQFGGNLHIADGQYWMGLLELRSTAGSSTFGLSNAGIIGQIMNPVNMPGSVSGLLPLGLAGSDWTNSNSHSTGWFGRHVGGVMTATSITNFLGTAMPGAITLSAIAGVAASNTISILPTVSFIST